MAAPDSTIWGSIANSKGKVGLYISTSSTNTTTTVTVDVWVWTRYGCYDSSNALYFTDNSTSATTGRGSVSFSHSVNSSWSTSNQTKIYTYTGSYARATTAKTVYCAAKLTDIDWVDADMSVSASYTIPALTSYAVTYNANGGSGAPGNQTKYYGANLTLSSTKPTKEGHSFLGWATTSSATSAAYAAGATYTSNAALSLYAVWKANTYTVTYDANGGSGAPASQTKTYGATLTLSATVPTRTNYNFLGWGISAASTSAAYTAGGSYTENASITLYAVWELAYSEPTISAVSAFRSDSAGNSDDFGTYGNISFSWACDQTQGVNAVSEITIQHKATSGTSWTSTAVSASGTSGSVNEIISGLSTESTYTVEISVSDSLGGATTITRTISAAAFPIDFLAGGSGVAMGKPASISGAFECGFTQFDKFGALVGNGLAAYTGGGDAGIDPDTTLEGLCLTSHTNAPQGLGTFYYILTVFYNTKSETAARAQIAFPYKKNGSAYHRYYSSGEWSSWHRYMTMDEVYPVNSVYISYSNTSPAELFGGTWHRMESRFLWGCPSTSEIGLTAGEMTHTLTTSEIPSHTHTIYNNSASGSTSAHVWSTTWKTTADSGSMKGSSIGWAGGGGAHNNMPPYVNVAIWRRTA